MPPFLNLTSEISPIEAVMLRRPRDKLLHLTPQTLKELPFFIHPIPNFCYSRVPCTVITYKRYTVSNQVLRDAGIIVVEIEGSELARGSGGPRSMSMPL